MIATQLRDAPRVTSPVGAAGRLRVRVARGAEVADVLDARWDALVAQAAIPNPTLTSDWLRELLPHARGRPLAVTVESEEGLVAGGLFEVLSVGRRGGPRLATLIAGGFSILYTDMPVASDAPHAALLVAEALLEEAHSFEILCTSEGAFAKALAERTPWCRVRPSIEGWVTPLPPPKLEAARRRAEYDLRRAERAGAVVTVRVAEESGPVAEALERLFDLHEERWHGRADALPRFSTTEDQRGFYRRAVGTLARSRKARLVEVVDDGVVVSSYLGLLCGRGALFHTTATRLGGTLQSPGQVGMVAWADAAVSAGAELMFLGRGATQPEGPKARIGGGPLPFVSVFAGRTKTIQQVLYQGLLLRHRARRLLGRVR